MSADASWASVAIAAVASGWGITTWILTRALRRASHDAVNDHKLADLAEDLAALAKNGQDQLQLLRTEVREDRAATNRRLRYLEEHLWKTSTRAR